MNKFFNNTFYKLYKIFLLLSGLFFLFVYGVKIRTDADNLIFADKSIAAVKFTFSELLFLPLAAFMAYVTHNNLIAFLAVFFAEIEIDEGSRVSK